MFKLDLVVRRKSATYAMMALNKTVPGLVNWSCKPFKIYRFSYRNEHERD